MVWLPLLHSTHTVSVYPAVTDLDIEIVQGEDPPIVMYPEVVAEEQSLWYKTHEVTAQFEVSEFWKKAEYPSRAVVVPELYV